MNTKKLLILVCICLIYVSCSKNKLTLKTDFDYRFAVSGSAIPNIGKVNTVKIDANGVKWFTTSHQLISYNNKQWTVYNSLDTSDHVYDIFPYNSVTPYMWMGISEGVFNLTTGNGIVMNNTLYNTSNSNLLSDEIYKIYVDASGIAWFASSNGPSYRQNNSWDTLLLNNPKSYYVYSKGFFKNFPITDFGVHGDTCYAPTNGAGVARFVINQKLDGTIVDGVTGASNYTYWGPCLMPTVVNCVYIDPGSTDQWYGTQQGLLQHQSFEFYAQWTFYTSYQNNLISDTVLTVVKDQKGTLWIGTVSGISTLIYPANNNISVNYNSANGLSNNCVNSLAVDVDGSIWAATNNGISHFVNNKWTAINSIN